MPGSHYGSCSECWTWTDLTWLGQQELCPACFNQHMNQIPHKCRGCGRTFNRLDGMHSTPLEPDGSFVLQYRRVREGPEEPWRDVPDVVNRVICAECCPAETHDDDVWCSIMTPWGWTDEC